MRVPRGRLRPEGETVDYSKVNVELTRPDGKVTTIGWVEDDDACPADEAAWFYDDRDNPTKDLALQQHVSS